MREIRLPCFLADNFGNIVAANGGIAALFNIHPDTLHAARTEPAGFSLMRVVFDQDRSRFAATVGNDWVRYARFNVQFFRANSFRYRHTAKFIAIFEALSPLPDFRKFWQEASEYEEDHYSTSLHYLYDHPTFERLSYYTASAMTLTRYGELSLTVHLPASTLTSEVFARLVKERDLVWRLASWPD